MINDNSNILTDFFTPKINTKNPIPLTKYNKNKDKYLLKCKQTNDQKKYYTKGTTILDKSKKRRSNLFSISLKLLRVDYWLLLVKNTGQNKQNVKKILKFKFKWLSNAKKNIYK